MIKIENVDIYGWEPAIRGMRNPKNSWDKCDSHYCSVEGRWPQEDCNECCYYPDDMCLNSANIPYIIGPKDLKLMKTLSKAGSDHGKFLRMINVTLDITAPLYWWKEFDTYKVGTVANSCSTMHKIDAKEFTLDDFSHEHLSNENVRVKFDNQDYLNSFMDGLRDIIDLLNSARKLYLETNDKKYWWQMIQLLPSSYNQKRTVQLNYQVLKSMYFARKNHKLDEWHTFCNWCETLPYFKEICLNIGE